jgi:TPR repeat protein
MMFSSILLGVLARDGNGVPRNDRAAYYHFRVASLQGGDAAAKLLENDLRNLSVKLGPVQAQAIASQAGVDSAFRVVAANTTRHISLSGQQPLTAICVASSRRLSSCL